jgi:hypothetical protein
MKVELTVPTVHINGTSRDELLEQIRDAYLAIGKAMEALAKASPNGRDYYPQGDEACRAARKEHQSRAERLASVRDELLTIGQSLQ